MRRLLASPLLRRALASLAVLVVAVFVIDLLSGYRQGQVASVAYFAVAAGGLTLLIGVNGQLSLGHGAFMAIGAYTTALLLQRDGARVALIEADRVGAGTTGGTTGKVTAQHTLTYAALIDKHGEETGEADTRPSS